MSISTDKRSSNFIKYDPELKKILGSPQRVLVFQQLEYWSSKYISGFWKFLEPCQHHPQYRPGDSWEEELGFSRRAFNKAFDLIGVRYKSKSEYLAHTDPFQGKMYLSYYDRKHNKTYFLRNHSLVENFITSIWQKGKKLPQKIRMEITKKCRSWSNRECHSFTRMEDISLQRSTSSFDTYEQNPPPTYLEAEKEEEKIKELCLAQEMLNLWNKITENKTPLRSDLKTKLLHALSRSFNNSLKCWEDYCKKVASSKFLMGESPHSRFKAYLSWLLKPATIQNIEEGVYSSGDREVTFYELKEEKKFNKNKIQGSDLWKKMCEQLSKNLGYATFNSWFPSLTLQEEENAHFKLKCPTLFIRDQIKSRYGIEVENILRYLVPQIRKIEIDV